MTAFLVKYMCPLYPCLSIPDVSKRYSYLKIRTISNFEMLSMAQTDNVKAFLSQCRESGDAAYKKLKEILVQLDNPNSRASARIFLAAVEHYIENELGKSNVMETYNFNIHKINLSNDEDSDELYGIRRQSLTLLEMSSIFLPENWSFTFYEGLRRHPDAGFRDREVTELGCGNGWISIALADRYSPRKVYGLDINPRAIKIAKINLYLNALNPNGDLILDLEGKSLLDRVEFHTSDLLQVLREKKIFVDRIVGCIPQVLNPDPKEALRVVQETMSEEFLYSLSNYCGMQGQVEDQFGLGLIARAVEESLEILRPSGVLILNIGGRPGKKVCERLFQRRGFTLNVLWQTRVQQAEDTDILPLVEIERESRHRFEFFLGSGSEEPVSARAAYLYQQAMKSGQGGKKNSGGGISHSLTVYEARLLQPNHVTAIFRFLNKFGQRETKGSLDLSFPDQSRADEKISFLAHLGRTLESTPCLKSDPPQGNRRFRKQVAQFLRLYFKLPIGVENVVVLPSRQVAVNSLLELYNARLALVDSSLIKYLPKEFLSSISPNDAPVVLEAPRQSDLLVELTNTLNPDLLLVSLADFEMRTSSAFGKLLEASSASGSRLFLDISDFLELSSVPPTNGVFQFLAENPLPPNCALICGLVKNQVYSDLEVCFAVSENLSFLRGLSERRGSFFFPCPTPSLPQLYYGAILQELIAFQMPSKDSKIQLRLPVEESKSLLVPLRTFQDLPPQLTPPKNLALVHMEDSQNFLETPEIVRRFVFKAFARQNLTEAEMDARPEILKYIHKNLGIRSESVAEIGLANGLGPLKSQLLASCTRVGATLLTPPGVCGFCQEASQLGGPKVKVLETKAENSFKLEPDMLEEFRSEEIPPWIVLPAPLLNPNGPFYSNAELAELYRKCQELGMRVIVDISFSGLEFKEDEENDVDLGSILSQGNVVILGEVAHQFSCGGLGFAFAATTESSLSELLRNSTARNKPHGTVSYAAKKILGSTLEVDPSLEEVFHERKTVLKKRAQDLQQALSDNGWDVVTSFGGLSLVAKPSKYEGKHYISSKSHGSGRESEKIILSTENIPKVLFEEFGLAIKGPHHSGLPGHSQIVFSVTESEFSEGLNRIKAFHDAIFN